MTTSDPYRLSLFKLGITEELNHNITQCFPSKFAVRLFFVTSSFIRFFTSYVSICFAESTIWSIHLYSALYIVTWPNIVFPTRIFSILPISAFFIICFLFFTVSVLFPYTVKILRKCGLRMYLCSHVIHTCI